MALSPIPYVAKSVGASGAAPKAAIPIALYGTFASSADWNTLANKPAVVASGATAAAALLSIGAAPLASPTFTGTPAAPTAAVATNTTQVATTAFVSAATRTKTQITALTPLATAGTSTVAQIETAVNAIIAALKA